MQAGPIEQRCLTAIPVFSLLVAGTCTFPKAANKIESEFHDGGYSHENVKMR